MQSPWGLFISIQNAKPGGKQNSSKSYKQHTGTSGGMGLRGNGFSSGISVYAGEKASKGYTEQLMILNAWGDVTDTHCVVM